MTEPRPLHEHVEEAVAAMNADGATHDEIEATIELIDTGHARVILEATDDQVMCIVTLPLDAQATTWWELLAVPASQVTDLPHQRRDP